MISILLDQGLARRAAALLRERGFEAKHVSELGMAAAEDAQILEVARQSDRICVTLDHDFHTHLAVAGDGSPSVILLRVEGLSAEEQSRLSNLFVFSASRRFSTELRSPPAATAFELGDFL